METPITIQTRFGLVAVHLNNDHHAVLRGDKLNVFRVEQSFQFRVERTGDAWRPEQERGGSDYHALHVSSRWDNSKHVEASFAARNAIKAACLEALEVWAKTPDARARLADAQRAEWNTEYNQHDEAIASLRDQIKEHQEAQRALRARMDAYQGAS